MERPTEEYYYECKCGNSFPEDLGKYGCANCEASSGPAKLIQAIT